LHGVNQAFFLIGNIYGLWLVNKSRINREVYVRFCERLKGKFLWSTRLMLS